MIEKYAKYIVAGALIIMFGISIAVSRGDSAIMDEVAHIPAGYSYVKYHDFRLNPEHPPLIKDLSGIPLQFLNVALPITEDFWTTAPNGQWQAGWRFLYIKDAFVNNTDQILFWSRFPIILMALLLGFFIYRWSKELFGAIAGVIALLLYAFDPNIIGHAHYVTTDLGMAAFAVFSFYYFIKYLKDPNYRNILLAGLFLGLAQLAKFSAPLLFPTFGITLFFYALNRKEKIKFNLLGSDKIKKQRLRNLYLYISSFILVVVICFIAIGVVYELNVYNMPPEKIHQLVDTQLRGETRAKVGPILDSMADNPILKPYAQYFTGFFMVISRVAGGNTTYFFGEVTNQSFRAYFPMVFLIKEPIPTLALIVFSIATALFFAFRNNFPNFKKKFSKNVKNYFSENIAEFSMLLFIFIYCYTSITGNLNIGFRHLFPILPFVYILVAKQVSRFGDHLGPNWKRPYWMVISFLILWLLLETVIIYPSYTAYFNELVGGSKNGHKYVTDSNVDWGQDLKRLENFVEENDIQNIRVDYFGGGDVKHYLGDKATNWHAHMGQENGWYAVSATFLQNSLYDKLVEGKPDYTWLRARQPYAQIGNSIMIYYINDVR